MKSILITTVCLLSCCLLFAQQDMWYRHIDESEGLPDNQVYHVFQDTKGFIWIATDRGLCRYDGVQFKTYTGNNMSSIAGSYIREDKWGRIWYATFDGRLYHTHGDSLQLWSTKNLEQPEYFLYDTSLWYFNNGHLLAFNLLHGTSRIVERNTSLAYIFQQDSIMEIDYLERQCVELHHPDGRLFKSFLARNKYLLHGLKTEFGYAQLEMTQPGFRLINDETGAILFQSSEAASVNACGVIGDDVWIAHTLGCCVINLRSGRVVNLATSQICTSLLKDKTGNFWIGTNKGIFLYPTRMQQRGVLMPGDHYRLQPHNKVIYAYNQTGQLARINPTNLAISNVYQNPLRRPYYQLLFENKGEEAFEWYDNKHPDFLQRIHDGDVSIVLFNPGVKRYARLSSMYYAISSSMYSGLIRNTAGNQRDIWDSIFTQYQKHNVSSDTFGYAAISLLASRTKWVTFDEQNKAVYYATSMGVYRLTPHEFSLVEYRGHPVYADEIICYQGDVWMLLTNGTTLFYRDHRFHEINAPLDMRSGSQWHARLFDSTLFVFNKHQIYFTNLTRQSLLNPHWNPISLFRKPGGISDLLLYDQRLFVTAGNELIEFPFQPNAKPGSPVFYLDGITGSSSTLFQTSSSASFSSGDISLRFNLLDYYHVYPEISYQINQQEWHDIPSTQRALEFASLAPGLYSIRFKINGIIQQEVANFNILKPWYTQLWFFILVALFLLLSVYLYYRLRFNRQQKENQLLLEKNRLEKDLRNSMLSSIKSQMNPHFLFNALNTIQSYIITEDKENASGYLSKFSRLTRKILEMSEQESIRLQEEIDALILYIDLEKMRFSDLNYTISIAQNLNTQTTQIPSMIIQPYVENAIKHGLLHKLGTKQLHLSFFKKEEMLCIEISDNGIGRQRSEEINKQRRETHRSFATQANKKRIELLNEENKYITVHYVDLMDANGTAEGTQVFITVPFKQRA